MGSLFGKPKKHRSRVTDHDKAVLQLKQQRDKLKQYQKKIYLTLEKERELAKRLLQENKKERAKLLLRKKKFQEQILQRTDQQLENLEKMTHDLEFAAIEVQVLNGLKTGNEALKKIHDVMSIDDIERILDETQEAVEKQREIDALLSGALSNQDEEDVLVELDNIIKESLPEMPEEELPVELPEVPSEEIGEREKVARHQRRVRPVAALAV